MSSVFISGSRQIPYLPEEVLYRLENIISQDIQVLIGDSEKGVDKEIAVQLKKEGFDNVTIFSIRSASRIKNLPAGWGFKTIIPEAQAKRDKNDKIINGRELETAKDRAMGDLCDYGLVVWQDTYTNHRFGQKAVSAGSLRNMVQLLMNGKPVALYYRSEDGYEFNYRELKSINDLEDIVQGLDQLVSDRFSKIVKAETAILECPKEESQLSLTFE